MPGQTKAVPGTFIQASPTLMVFRDADRAILEKFNNVSPGTIRHHQQVEHVVGLFGARQRLFSAASTREDGSLTL